LIDGIKLGVILGCRDGLLEGWQEGLVGLDDGFAVGPVGFVVGFAVGVVGLPDG
jgi:hypothetical protein